MVKVSIKTELSNAIEARALQEIRDLQKDIGELNCLREAFGYDWEIVELTRAIIHDEAHFIQSLQKEIEDARAADKRSEKL